MKKETIQKPQSRLSEGGGNVFQRVKQEIAEALEEGIDLIDLTIGEPEGPAIPSARRQAAKAVKSKEPVFHSYMDNGDLAVEGFARDFIGQHLRHRDIVSSPELSTLLLPGIKPMFQLIPVACGAGCGHGQPERELKVVTTTNPGYPTPAYWAKMWGCEVIEPPLAESDFKLTPEMIPEDADLVMVNSPHNPSGQALTAEDWHALCEYCAKNGTRLVNDAAYAGLAHSARVSTLADRAFEFTSLFWMELFSASKLIGNGTGWRVAAALGSKDFIGDLARIKGNADSGGFPPAFAGVHEAVNRNVIDIDAVRRSYLMRVDRMIECLHERNMKLAVDPKAGFFTLWKVPNKAFGREINGNGEEFAKLLIRETGVAGVPFGSFIRFASCTKDADRIEEIEEAFKKADVSY